MGWIWYVLAGLIVLPALFILAWHFFGKKGDCCKDCSGDCEKCNKKRK
ncbi:MAG: hypothetical protein J5854_05300 [Clostridia bacterium]|nr:hypothetical protein [Clostridia bacterium]